MNDTLQQALATLISTTINAWDTATTFLIEEIPQVIYQLLLWHAVYSFIKFCLGLFLIIFFCFSLWYFYARWLNKPITMPRYKGSSEIITQLRKDKYDLSILAVPWTCVGFLISFLAFDLINLTWLQIWIAPKIWLIEYATKLVK